MDPELVAFLADVTRWLGGKDVLFAEFGAPTKDGDPEAERVAGASLLSEMDAARYTADAFARLYKTGTIGALVWCYSDYDRAIWGEPPLDRAPHERHFGLWRADGTPKPAAAALGEWAGRPRKVAAPLRWSEADRERFRAAPRDELMRLYRAYADADRLARPVL
jgi:endo-1,4-beta-mannosidase